MRALPQLTMAMALVWLGCGSDPSEGAPDATAADTLDVSKGDSPTADAVAGDTSDSSTATVTITFAITVPPETPADQHPRVSVGAAFTEQRLDVPAGTLDWTVHLGDAVELDQQGAPVVHHSVVASDTTLSATVLRWGPAGGQSDADVAFLVRVPAATNSTTGLWISGNQPALGDWSGTGLRLVRAQADYWAAVLTTAPSTTLAFKVTRGAWTSVEKGSHGEELDNHEATAAERYQRVTVDVVRWADDPSTTPTGHARIDTIHDVGSQYLSPHRDVLVWLPPGYDSDTTRTYPVLYMHDGQNLFEAETSAFGTEWEVDETAEALVLAGDIEPLIIVGVDNTGDRIPEYTPTRDSDYDDGGDADDYGRFLVDELKPRIDQTYRTRPAASETGLCGSSLGGLVSMYLGLQHADTFGRIGVMSPSVWWDNRVIVDDVEALTMKLPLRVWLDIGSDEGGGESVQDAAALKDALVAEGWVLGADLAYTVYQGASHDEASWAARMDDVLRWLYPATP